MRQSQARRHGGHSGTVPPPNQGLCPEEINRLGASGVQIEAYDSRIGVYRPYLWTHTGFYKTFGTKTFFFGLHLRIRGKLQEF